MSLTLVSFLIGALALYSFFFIRRAGEVQHGVLLPFLHRIHAPKVLKTISNEEHNGIHHQINIFNIRILSCFVASVIAVGVSGLFLMLVSNGGDAQAAGFIMAVCFAYVCANYDLNSKIINWVYLSENELLARVVQNNADEGGFKSLSDYLVAENQKMLKEWQEEVVKVGEEFEARLIELGYDPERDYLESPESEEELTQLLEQVTNEFEEKYDKPPGL